MSVGVGVVLNYYRGVQIGTSSGIKNNKQLNNKVDILYSHGRNMYFWISHCYQRGKKL